MSNWAMSTADDRVQSSMTLDSTTRLSSIDMWIGSRVRVKRTSRRMNQQVLSQLLDIDCDKLAAYEAGEERINANLLFCTTKLLDVRPDYFFRGYMEATAFQAVEHSPRDGKTATQLTID